MELHTYCNGMATELTGWKAKVYDVMRKFDDVSSGDKAYTYQHVNELHMIIDELGDRIEKLRAECPTSWEAEKNEMDDKLVHLRRKWEETWDESVPSAIGG